jgi:hypothetical protein
VIWTTPELSVINVIHLLLKALPHNCIATTTDSEVQRRISIDGSTSHSELSGHSATLKQIQNVATDLIHGSLEKSSKESNRRVFAFYKECMLFNYLVVGLIQLFLQFLKMHEMQANTLHATLIVKTLKNRFWVEIDINL